MKPKFHVSFRFLRYLRLPAACHLLLAFLPPAFLLPAFLLLALSGNAQTPHIYWGDIHCHTNYSDCPAADSAKSGPKEAILYARDSVMLDFVCVTDHSENLDQWEWDSVQIYNNMYYQPGEFVTFHGWEYTKTGLNFVPGGGHKHVLFGDNNVPPVAVGSDSIVNLTDYSAFLAPYNCITVPHHPAKGTNGHWEMSSMSTDWSAEYLDTVMQPVVEIYQSQGNSEIAGCEEAVRDFQQDCSVEAALKRWLVTHNAGYKLGIVGSTDDHLALPGSVQELAANVDTLEGYSSGGLIAVVADTLTRSAIFSAIHNKQVYATSGSRILLNFYAVHGQDTIRMGQTKELADTCHIRFHVSAVGDNAPIQKIMLIRNGDTISETMNDTLVIADQPDNWSYYHVKVFQEPTLRWDGAMVPERAWSSPMWFEVFPVQDTAISGNLTYDNSSSSALPGVKLYLVNSLNVKVDSTFTGLNGKYAFKNVWTGTYQVKGKSNAAWGGVNSVDAQLILKQFVGITSLTGVRLLAADVDASGYVNSIDALQVAKRFTGLISSFPGGDWVFLPTTIQYNGTRLIQQLKGLCNGDVNGSYNP
jgi:hypothetical protein